VADVALFVVGMENTGFQITADLVFGNEIFDQRFGGFSKDPEFPCALQPDKAFQFILILALPGSQLTAIAARSAPADTVRVKQVDLVATLSQMQCRGKTSVACTNHADVAGVLSFQHRKGELLVCSRGVVGGRVFACLVVGVKKALRNSHVHP